MSALATGRPLAVMLSPAISLLSVFVAAPTALTIWLAFQDWSTETGFGEARFVGFDNFVEMFGSTSVGRDFKGALVNTTLYTLASVAVILPLSSRWGCWSISGASRAASRSGPSCSRPTWRR